MSTSTPGNRGQLISSADRRTLEFDLDSEGEVMQFISQFFGVVVPMNYNDRWPSHVRAEYRKIR
jgi:hypothetical protein